MIILGGSNGSPAARQPSPALRHVRLLSRSLSDRGPFRQRGRLFRGSAVPVAQLR